MNRLSPKEKLVWEFICQFTTENDYVPSYTEIKEHFGFASLFSVQRYIQQLSDKAYIQSGQNNQKRALQILKWPKASTDKVDEKSKLLNKADSSKTANQKNSKSNTSNETNTSNSENGQLPFLGKVAAGAPIDFHLQNHFIEVPIGLLKSFKDAYVVQVAGDSMIELGILDGDYAIIRHSNKAENSDIIVASIDGESTLKSFFHDPKRKLEEQIELRPANHKLSSRFLHPAELKVEGKLAAIFRKY